MIQSEGIKCQYEEFEHGFAVNVNRYLQLDVRHDMLMKNLNIGCFGVSLNKYLIQSDTRHEMLGNRLFCRECE